MKVLFDLDLKEMKKEIPKRISILKTASIIVLIVGLLLLVYMVRVEDEPGALPLFFILVGLVGVIVNQVRINRIKNDK